VPGLGVEEVLGEGDPDLLACVVDARGDGHGLTVRRMDGVYNAVLPFTVRRTCAVGTSVALAMDQRGWGDAVVRLPELPPAAIIRKDGRITEVRVPLQFRIDIDEVRGRAQLDLNNGTEQGYALDFKVEA
jgi:hypothetical protein